MSVNENGCGYFFNTATKELQTGTAFCTLVLNLFFIIVLYFVVCNKVLKLFQSVLENSVQISNNFRARKSFYITPTHVQVSPSADLLNINLKSPVESLVEKRRLTC